MNHVAAHDTRNRARTVQLVNDTDSSWQNTRAALQERAIEHEHSATTPHALQHAARAVVEAWELICAKLAQALDDEDDFQWIAAAMLELRRLL